MILQASLSLLAAMLIHELGHLVAARACQVPAPELGLGWGPRVWGFRRGGVEFKLHALPVGAYVRFDVRALQDRPLSQQALVLLAGVVVNLCAAALSPGTVFGAMNLLLAATNLLPFYQQDGWKCGIVMLRGLAAGRRSPLVEWTFTVAGACASCALVAAQLMQR